MPDARLTLLKILETCTSSTQRRQAEYVRVAALRTHWILKSPSNRMCAGAVKGSYQSPARSGELGVPRLRRSISRMQGIKTPPAHWTYDPPSPWFGGPGGPVGGGGVVSQLVAH